MVASLQIRLANAPSFLFNPAAADFVPGQSQDVPPQPNVQVADDNATTRQNAAMHTPTPGEFRSTAGKAKGRTCGSTSAESQTGDQATFADACIQATAEAPTCKQKWADSTEDDDDEVPRANHGDDDAFVDHAHQDGQSKVNGLGANVSVLEGKMSPKGTETTGDRARAPSGTKSKKNNKITKQK